MARRDSVVDEVETVDETDAPSTEASAPSAEPKAKKEPARGELPEGYVTPVGLATEITKQGLHKDKDGNVTTLKPQMVYSYMKNAPKDHPFPIETVTDSLGKERQALKLEAGITWWTERQTLAADRKAAAAQKKAEKEARAAAKAAEAPSEAESTEVTEAE